MTANWRKVASARRRADLIMIVLFFALIGLTAFSLTIGRYPVPLADIARIMFTTVPGEVHSYTDKSWVVIETIRMPRILGAALCGMGLALGGAAMQGVLRNPLVSPEVAGVSSVAAFGGVVAVLLVWPITALVGMAFCVGLLALAAAFGLARLTGKNSVLALLLSGVITGSFFGSLTAIAQYIADFATKLPSIIFWLMGSFTAMTYQKVAVIAPVTLLSGALLMLLRWRINLLSLGDDDAQSLGLNVQTLRWSVIALVALMVAAQVAVSGGIAFVGLVIPHLARMLVGAEHSRHLPVSALLGGIYLLAIDDIARTATDQEIPIGLLTSLVGLPVFAWLFWRLQNSGWAPE